MNIIIAYIYFVSWGNRLRLTEIKFMIWQHTKVIYLRGWWWHACAKIFSLRFFGGNSICAFWLLWWWETRNSWGIVRGLREKVKISNWENFGLICEGKLMRWERWNRFFEDLNGVFGFNGKFLWILSQIRWISTLIHKINKSRIGNWCFFL